MTEQAEGDRAGKIRVVVAGSLPPDFPTEAFDERVAFQVARTADELRSAVEGANVLFASHVPENAPEATPQLQWIQFPSAGIDYMPRAIWDSDIVLTSSRGIHTVPMAEHAFALLLALIRQIPTFVRAQERREWIHDVRARQLRLTELRGKTLGIVGWGKIGDGIAHLASAFGMRVIGTRWSLVVPREVQVTGSSPYTNPPWLEPLDLPPDIAFPAAQFAEVLSQSDVVLSILPLTPRTHHFLGRTEFAAMRRGSLFLNLGRGPVVDEPALVEALRSGRLAGAGLDVFEEEPLPRSSPLWGMETVIISPHVGGLSDQTRERAAHFFAVNLARFLDGQSLLNIIDRERGY